MNELVQAVAGYLDHVWVNLMPRLGREPNGDSTVPKVLPMGRAVQEWFEEFEKTALWDEVVKACVQIFSQEGHSKSEVRYRDPLKNWFRRKGEYLRILEGTRPNPVGVAEALAKDLRAVEDRVVYLVLLEGAYFKKDVMDFGDFQIIRPKAPYLEGLLGLSVNRLFYPDGIISTERLMDHWYLRCESREKRGKLGLERVTFEMVGGPVKRVYTGFDATIEASLKEILLWDWQPGYHEAAENDFTHEKPWIPFSVPFVIVSRDNPLQFPPPAPPVGNLYYEPLCDASGEEDGETPGYWYALDAEETERFEALIQSAVAKRKRIQELGDPWPFIDIGLSYIGKAFFSEGLEQLLWHIVALEAFLGEKGQGVTKRLTRRVGAIYSIDPVQRENARRAFHELYKLRNNLIHGAAPTPVDAGHLRRARMLARKVGLRMLALLGGIAEAIEAGQVGPVPIREDILEVLDSEETRARLPELVQVFRRLDE